MSIDITLLVLLGKLFHSFGAAEINALYPSVDCVALGVSIKTQCLRAKIKQTFP